jgi:hypothetical protein
MLLMNWIFGGTVDLYTMDHRGTGRSSRLSCVASQVETSGNPNGVFANCIQDINVELGNITPNHSMSYAFFILLLWPDGRCCWCGCGCCFYLAWMNMYFFVERY